MESRKLIIIDKYIAYLYYRLVEKYPEWFALDVIKERSSLEIVAGRSTFCIPKELQGGDIYNMYRFFSLRTCRSVAITNEILNPTIFDSWDVKDSEISKLLIEKICSGLKEGLVKVYYISNNQSKAYLPEGLDYTYAELTEEEPCACSCKSTEKQHVRDMKTASFYKAREITINNGIKLVEDIINDVTPSL